jgi:hypothetical protein
MKPRAQVYVRFKISPDSAAEREYVVSMRHRRQQQRTNASRLPGVPAGLTMLAMMWLGMATLSAHGQAEKDAVPDAPSTLLYGGDSGGQQTSSPQASSQSNVPKQTAVADPTGPVPPCPRRSKRGFPILFSPLTQSSCQDQLQLIVETGSITPLISKQKGLLAVRAFTDPFNLLTIATFSGISVAADAHTVYGPGFAGWGRLAGYSLAEDAQGDFTGVYVLPSVFHEDPRYHRMSKATVRRRIEHALIHTIVSQHDDGSVMLNYATLVNIPLSAEISNLYVPEIGTNVPDTAKRILVGYATDPIGPLVAEFLPDFAKRVHIHIIFAQQVLNRIALGSGAPSSSY